MPNKPKKNNPKKTKPKPKAKQSKKVNNKKSNGSVAKQHHVKEACSILNPFCTAAKGSRRPDGLGSNTMPYQARNVVKITTNASGSALVVFVPGYGYYGSAIGTLATPTWTIASAWTSTPSIAFLNTNAAEVRLLSCGIKFLSIASATTSQGLVHIYTLQNAFAGQTIPELNLNNAEDFTSPIQGGVEAVWLSKPVGTAAHDFRDTASINNTMTDFNWTCCVVEITGGAPSTTIGMVEFVSNVEFTLKPAAITTTGLGSLLQNPKKANPIATSIQSTVQSGTPGIMKGGYDAVEKVITNAATTAVNNLASSAEDYLMGFMAFL
jgi:hypothetical protein